VSKKEGRHQRDQVAEKERNSRVSGWKGNLSVVGTQVRAGGMVKKDLISQILQDTVMRYHYICNACRWTQTPYL
jgi:hypothetical protein